MTEFSFLGEYQFKPLVTLVSFGTTYLPVFIQHSRNVALTFQR